MNAMHMIVEDQKNSYTVLLCETDHQLQTGDSLTVTDHLKENRERLGCHIKILDHLYLLERNQVVVVKAVFNLTNLFSYRKNMK